MQRGDRRRFARPPATRAGEPPRRPRRGWLPRRQRRAAVPLTAGRDLSQPPERSQRVPRVRQVAVVVAGAVCAALLLVVLRVDSIRQRYRLADAVRTEHTLLEQQRRLSVDVRRLRHPLRLAELGRELGLGRAERVIALDDAARAR
jgi:hypothetical protein